MREILVIQENLENMQLREIVANFNYRNFNDRNMHININDVKYNRTLSKLILNYNFDTCNFKI